MALPFDAAAVCNGSGGVCCSHVLLGSAICREVRARPGQGLLWPLCLRCGHEGFPEHLFHRHLFGIHLQGRGILRILLAAGDSDVGVPGQDRVGGKRAPDRRKGEQFLSFREECVGRLPERAQACEERNMETIYDRPGGFGVQIWHHRDRT